MVNIQANSLSLQTLQSTSAVQTGTLKTSTQEATTTKPAQSDTLTISAAGMALFQQSQATQEALNAISEGEAERALEDDTALLESAVASSDESEDSDSTNLATLTEQQIKQLVSDGKITQAQAQAELASRQVTLE